MADERKDSRGYGSLIDEDGGKSDTPSNRRKKNMRGRKGKYNAEDDDDMQFLEKQIA